LGHVEHIWRRKRDAGQGCLVRLKEDKPRDATVAKITAHLEPHPDAMLLTVVS
jgi:hypothetical protein